MAQQDSIQYIEDTAERMLFNTLDKLSDVIINTAVLEAYKHYPQDTSREDIMESDEMMDISMELTGVVYEKIIKLFDNTMPVPFDFFKK